MKHMMNTVAAALMLLTVGTTVNTMSAQDMEMGSKKVTFEKPRNVVKVGGALSFITSSVYVMDMKTNKIVRYRGRIGFGPQIDYEHYWKSGWGVGLNISGNMTSFPNGVSSEKMYTLYIGPSLLYQLQFGGRWRLSFGLGAGYATWDDRVQTQSNVGIQLKAGLEYMLSRHIGVGVDFNDLFFFSKETKDEKDFKKQYDEDYFSGIARSDIAAGVRFYF